MDERLGVVIVFDLDSWEIFAAVLLAMLSISARALADEMTSNDWFLIGQELYGAGSYEEAVAAYDEAIAMEPDKGTLQFFKGNALYALAMASGFDLPISAGAIDAYEEAVRLDPTSAKPWWGKARVLSLISNSLEGDERAEVMEKALSAIKMATEIDPFFVDAWICRGRILDELAALTRDFCRYDQSLQAYERAIELLPFSDARSLALAWDGKVVALSHLAQDLADGDEGEEDLDIREEAAFAHGGVIGLGSESPGLEVRLKRARGFANLGRYDDAIDAYDEAADAAPEDLPAYAALVLVEKAAVLLEMGEGGRSLASLKEATVADPGNATAWRKRGDLLSALGRRSEAEAARSRARELEEKGSSPHFSSNSTGRRN